MDSRGPMSLPPVWFTLTCTPSPCFLRAVCSSLTSHQFKAIPIPFLNRSPGTPQGEPQTPVCRCEKLISFSSSFWADVRHLGRGIVPSKLPSSLRLLWHETLRCAAMGYCWVSVQQTVSPGCKLRAISLAVWGFPTIAFTDTHVPSAIPAVFFMVFPFFSFAEQWLGLNCMLTFAGL